MPNLTLYHFPTCPFCAKVLRFLNEENINIETKDISNNRQFYQELIDKTGRQSVPVLFIDNKPLYESLDIIKWLGDNKV